MKFLVINCNLAPVSRTSVAATETWSKFDKNDTADLIHLSELSLPICEGKECYKHHQVIQLTERVKKAKGVILTVPIYNYAANAATKNLIELMGSAWQHKVVGFVCTAGGEKSYLAILPTANSLMVNFRTLIIPRFVYIQEKQIQNGIIESQEVHHRLQQLVDELKKLASAI